MRAKSSLRELMSGQGLLIAVTVTLSIAAMLAAVGLFEELADARLMVLAERRPALSASQAGVAPLSRPAAAPPDGAGDSTGAAADDDDENDPAADFHPDQPVPVARMLAAPGRQDGDGSGESPTTAPSPVADAPIAAPGPTSSPEPIGEAALSPASVAARVKPDPGPRGPPRASADLPIVMYHHVGPLPPNPDIFRKDLTVAPAVFDQTLDRLADQGVQTVTMADLFEHFKGGPELPKRSAILTFDDGYDDVYEYAFHSLLKHGMVGTFFICTDFVDKPGYLSWDQIHEMADAGMEIAAHSINHPDFTLISPAELRRQLTEPKAILEEQLGHPIPYLAYPSGKYNAAVIAASKAAGYEAAVTVIHGTHHTPSQAFELRRVRAHGADSVGEIVARMTPASWRQ